MKYILPFLLLLFCTTINGQEYVLNSTLSKIDWTGYGEIGGFKQEGTIKTKKGSIQFINDDIQSARILIDMKSIDHQDKSLRKHLSNKDFFWTKKYPIAEMNLLSFEDDIIVASVSIRGITQSISFPVSIEKNENNIVIKGTMTIDRILYGIKYNSSSFFQDLGSYAIKDNFDLKFELIFE